MNSQKNWQKKTLEIFPDYFRWMTTPIYRKTQRSSRAQPDWTQSSPGPQASTTFWDNLQFSWPHSILPKTQDKRKHPDDEDVGCLCHNYKFKTQTMRRKKNIISTEQWTQAHWGSLNPWFFPQGWQKPQSWILGIYRQKTFEPCKGYDRQAIDKC